MIKSKLFSTISLIIIVGFGVGIAFLAVAFYFPENEIFFKTDSSLFENKISQAIKNDMVLLDDLQNMSYIISSEVVQSWIESKYRDFLGKRTYSINEEKIKDYIISLPVTIARQPVNGKLGIDEKGNLYEVVPSVRGLVLNPKKTAINIMDSLKKGKNWSNIVFDELEPKISLAKAVGLGVTGLLAKGESNFAGSPLSRAHNISVGAGVYNGLIVRPNEEFSFNDLLGTVDESTGYKPELVVKNHKIFPEYGGGLCQVSTTAFRAATLAGLPITERRNHSLALRYYSPQGFDAAIYPGVTDMKFLNNTPNNILIQTEIINTRIYFYFFGVSDGRTVVMDGPKILSQENNGAMKTILYRTITLADGTVKKDSFYSEYSPTELYPIVKNPLE